MVFELNKDDLSFPDLRLDESDGLIAMGGDLSPDRLILAYSYGIFPWFSFRDCEEPLWFCPMQRFVIFPEEIHISHSMRTLINKNRYEVTFNLDFDGVIRGCSEMRYDMDGAWLGEDMIAAYTELHRRGFAASVEVWDDEDLVGGLYGVVVGNGFIGESMFSRVPSASKLALIGLASRLAGTGGGAIIDCQLETPHLKSMGGRFIPYEEYLKLLGQSPLPPLAEP